MVMNVALSSTPSPRSEMVMDTIVSKISGVIQTDCEVTQPEHVKALPHPHPHSHSHHITITITISTPITLVTKGLPSTEPRKSPSNISGQSR